MSGSSIIHVQISIANITTGVTSSVGVSGHEDDDKFYYILYLCPQGINKIKCIKKLEMQNWKTHRLLAQEIALLLQDDINITWVDRWDIRSLLR